MCLFNNTYSKTLMHDIKKIIIKLLFFSIPLLFVLGYVEYNLRTKHLVSSYAVKKYLFEKQLDSIEILVLGNSQMFNGVDVDCFNSKAFNLANVSQTLHYDKELTEKYLPKMPKLKTVIIGISYFSFFYEMCDIEEKWREDFYDAYFNISGCKLNKASKFYVSLYQPKQAFKLALNSFEDESAKSILYNGYQPKFIQKQINDSEGLKRVKVHNAENFYFRRNEIEKKLSDFVEKLRRKNIRIVFVTTPVFNTYSKFCDSLIVSKNTNYIADLCNKYNCKYLNFFTDKRFVISDFEDNDHLKNNGARKLSKIMNDTLFALY